MGDRRSDPPGAVSDQMPEEQPSGLRKDEHHHPEPRGGDSAPDSGRNQPADTDNEGEATEGSQSTGHPENAG